MTTRYLQNDIELSREHYASQDHRDQLSKLQSNDRYIVITGERIGHFIRTYNLTLRRQDADLLRDLTGNITQMKELQMFAFVLFYQKCLIEQLEVIETGLRLRI